MRIGTGALCALSVPGALVQAEVGKPYRLEAVDLKERVIWGVELREPEGHGLAFGGQDQEAEDGRPHTRVLAKGKWIAIHEKLRAANPLQALHDEVWSLRDEVKDLGSRARRIYFGGRAEAEEGAEIGKNVRAGRDAVASKVAAAATALERAGRGVREREPIEVALGKLRRAGELLGDGPVTLDAEELNRLRLAQECLEQAAEALDAEPAARSLDCGPTRGGGEDGPGAKGLVYDPKTQLYVLFGGDHLDYLTNETWIFDPSKWRWIQRFPEGAPPPRANHRLVAKGDGTIGLSGGYTYTSNPDYVGGQYADLNDGPWTYDVAKNEWRGGALIPGDTRVYRTGPFHPDFYMQGPKPDATAFAQRLADLPVNEWLATEPPFKPRLNRDWGMAVIDPDRDLMLRWSGGHSAHGGTDVLHYHFATNRWELSFPVEFPLGQLYSNTSYPDGFNYNLRPWMTGHTYQNYQYDPPSKLMVKAGRPRHFYLYDPDRGDWIGRGMKPEGMIYDSCFYTLTLTSTPQGALSWGANGKVHRYSHADGRWDELALQGDELPGAVVDNSTIAYDSRRERVYMIVKPYGEAPFDGRVWSLDLEAGTVTAETPAGMGQAHRFAYIDRWVYDPVSDLVLLASYLNGAGEHTPTPAYDPAANRWVTLDLGYQTVLRDERVRRVFPHGRSDGIVFDPKRKLIWGTDTNSEVYVLRLERGKANVKPLE